MFNKVPRFFVTMFKRLIRLSCQKLLMILLHQNTKALFDAFNYCYSKPVKSIPILLQYCKLF